MNCCFYTKLSLRVSLELPLDVRTKERFGASSKPGMFLILVIKFSGGDGLWSDPARSVTNSHSHSKIQEAEVTPDTSTLLNVGGVVCRCHHPIDFAAQSLLVSLESLSLEPGIC